VTAAASTDLVRAPETAPAASGQTPQIAGPSALSYVDDAEPYDAETLAILATPVNPELVEVRNPGDLLFVNWIHYQTILVKAFGIGGFRMVPKTNSPPRLQGNTYTWHGSLWVRPRGSKKFQFVDEAVGECNIQSAGNGPEGAKSDCLTKCCKRLHIFMELFDPAWRRWWQTEFKPQHERAKAKHARVERDRAVAPSAPAPATGSTATPSEAAPADGAAGPAASADTGEAATNEQMDALAGEIKRRKWKTAWTRQWLQQHFQVDRLGALTEQQAAEALVKIMQMPAGAA
jgi:hypothetical protein